MRQLLVLLLLSFVAGCGRIANGPPAAAPPDRASWTSLSKGMTPDQVESLLGKPLRVETQGEVTCWHYQKGRPLQRYESDDNRWIVPRGALLFSADAAGLTLVEWREP